MNREHLIKILTDVKLGSLEVDDAVNELKILPYEDLGYAKIDHHRALRTGFPEVVFCQGKQPEQVVEIMKRLSSTNKNVLATRADSSVYKEVQKEIPNAMYHKLARCITINNDPLKRYLSPLLIISAGTADLPVAEEAAVTAEVMGINVVRLFDVGVAGIHRLLDHRDMLDKAAVIIVVAGMEGALASVVAGLVDIPVIAVPTSIGYGASFGGIAALLSMLNSCASGLSVVNIDNGFGAAAMASSIIHLKEEK